MQQPAAEKSFRAEVRAWLRDNVPGTRTPKEPAAQRAFDLAWQKRQFEGGWAGISWPKAFGGSGLSLVEQFVWYEEYARAKAPRPGSCFIGLSHAGPTIMARGTDEQKQFHLPRILRGDVVWCQGFSEPDAGSDLASIKTSGRVEGDEFVVNGSKIWTTYAHLADYQELLIRTDPAASKHKGLTWLICDMKAPGITVTPIVNIAGQHVLNQVFYDEVRIPLANVVGAVNDGWSVAMSTLSFERGPGLAVMQTELAQYLERLAEQVRLERGSTDSDGILPQLALMQAEVAALRSMNYAFASQQKGGAPSVKGSMVKLYFAELKQRALALAVEAIGPGCLEIDPGDGWNWAYLDSFSATIAGGSSQIQRNIIGERILGLPRE